MTPRPHWNETLRDDGVHVMKANTGEWLCINPIIDVVVNHCPWCKKPITGPENARKVADRMIERNAWPAREDGYL